mgnify:CR=1 FL=1
MISFEVGDFIFNYRVAAVCRRAGRVLMVQQEGTDFWFLPGGRCEAGESSRDALRRELREELAVDVRIEGLLWVVENFFELGGRSFHELSLYYECLLPESFHRVDLDTSYPWAEVNGTAFVLRWFPISGLSEIKLLPEFLQQGLQHPPEHVQHLICRG